MSTIFLSCIPQLKSFIYSLLIHSDVFLSIMAIGSSKSFVSLGKKPLPEPVMTKI